MKLLFSKSSYITQSVSRKGNCRNAVAESFFKPLKYECTNRHNFKTFLQACQIIDDCMQWITLKDYIIALDHKIPLEIEYYSKLKKLCQT